jgi:lambda repressor-like predicted transcriptional regulator
MLTWAEIEAERKRLGLSCAKMCRLAGISESTHWKGLKAGTPPSAVIAKSLSMVLTDYRARMQAA